MGFIAEINRVIFGPALFFGVFGAGAFLAARTRFFILRRPAAIVKALFSKSGEPGAVSPFAAACTALAGTLGVGNIVGVSTAVAAGGAGALFWMWVSAAAAAVLKYSEVALGIKYRVRKNREWHGGAPYYIKNAAGMPRAAAVFAALCVAASFTLGNAVQIRAAAQSARIAAGIPPVATGAATAVFCLAVTFGGIKRIASFTSRAVPVLSAVFVVIALAVIGARAQRIPEIMAQIVRSAFTPEAGAGGAAGIIVSRAVRYGMARGLGSNEAGCGTAPTAHAAARTASGADQGVWGIAEVFVDTVVLCTLCGLMILVNGTGDAGEGVAPVIEAARGVFGAAAAPLVCVCIYFFALSTILCWSYYGTEAVAFLTPSKRAKAVYLSLFFAACVPFSAVGTEFLWQLSDLSVGAMTAMNVAVLCARSGEIARMTRDRFK